MFLWQKKEFHQVLMGRLTFRCHWRQQRMLEAVERVWMSSLSLAEKAERLMIIFYYWRQDTMRIHEPEHSFKKKHVPRCRRRYHYKENFFVVVVGWNVFTKLFTVYVCKLNRKNALSTSGYFSKIFSSLPKRCPCVRKLPLYFSPSYNLMKSVIMIMKCLLSANL